MHRKREIGAGIGIPSIIMIFTVLCLLAFGVLALITVDRDRALTKKTEQSVLNFYAADSEGQKWLAYIDEQLILARQEAEALAGWGKLSVREQVRRYREYVTERLKKDAGIEVVTKGNGELEVYYKMPVDSRQILQINIAIQDYEVEDKNRYSILEWAVSPGADWEYKALEFENIEME